jgi:hypothetical protein
MGTKQKPGSTPALVLTLLLAAAAADPATVPAAAADLQGQVSDVTDTRSLSSSSTGLAIEVRLSGAALAGAEAFRTTLQRASDDTGRSLIPAKAAPAEFTTIEAGSPPQARLALKLASPARKAYTVGPMAGVLELYVPARDPASVITVPQVAAPLYGQLVLLFHPRWCSSRHNTSSCSSSAARVSRWSKQANIRGMFSSCCKV